MMGFRIIWASVWNILSIKGLVAGGIEQHALGWTSSDFLGQVEMVTQRKGFLISNRQPMTPQNIKDSWVY